MKEVKLVWLKYIKIIEMHYDTYRERWRGKDRNQTSIIKGGELSYDMLDTE